MVIVSTSQYYLLAFYFIVCTIWRLNRSKCGTSAKAELSRPRPGRMPGQVTGENAGKNGGPGQPHPKNCRAGLTTPTGKRRYRSLRRALILELGILTLASTLHTRDL